MVQIDHENMSSYRFVDYMFISSSTFGQPILNVDFLQNSSLLGFVSCSLFLHNYDVTLLDYARNSEELFTDVL